MRSDGNQHHTGLEQNLDKAIRKYKHFFCETKNSVLVYRKV